MKSKMINKYKNVILIFLLLNCIEIYSQGFNVEEQKFKEFTPAKLDAKPFEFFNYSNLGSVNTLTGGFGLNIPFHSIETPFFTLPITLNYSTNGVKLNTISNEIGLDWNLIAGGNISRVVNGEPDDVFKSIGDYYKQTSDIQVHDLLPNEYRLGQIYPAYRPNFLYGGIFGSYTNVQGSHYQIKFPYRMDSYNDPTTNPMNSEIGCLIEMKFRREWNNDSHTGAVVFDNQADIFSFNVGNKSFKFILKRKPENYGDVAGVSTVYLSYIEAVPLDDLGYKIEIIDINNNLGFFKKNKNLNERTLGTRFIKAFEVTDKEGIKYLFEKFEYTDFDILKQYDNQFNGANVIVTGKRVIDYKEYWTQVNKWYLTKIKLPNNETIDFNYTINDYLYQKDVNRSHDGVYLNKPYNLNPKDTPYGIDWLDIHTEGYSLDEIIYNQQKVKFTYDNYRPDYKSGGLSLKKMELFYANQLIKKIDLIKEFKFFDDDGHNYYRMYLKEINDSQLQHSHIFEYNNPELNKRADVRYQDIFGYYLGNSINTYPSFPTIYISPNDVSGNKISYEIPNSANYFIINGTNRNPNPLYTNSGTMKKVSFPTGGYLEIDYENNTYSDDRLLFKKTFGPGVRVKTLNYYTKDSELSLKKGYVYDLFANSASSSGKLLYKPSYAFISNWSLNNSFDRAVYENGALLDENSFSSRAIYWSRIDYDNFYTYEMLNLNSALTLEDKYKKMLHFSNYPMGPTNDIYGRELIYENVTESIIGNNTLSSLGKTRFYYKYVDNRVLVNSVSGPSDEPCDFVKGNRYTTHRGLSFFPFWSYKNSGQQYFKTRSGLIEKKGYEIYPFPNRNYFRNIENASLGKLIKVEVFNSDNELVSSEESEYDYIMKESPNINVLQNISTGYLKLHQYNPDDTSETFQKAYWGSVGLTFHEANRQNFNGLYMFSSDSLRFNNKVVLKKKRVKKYSNNGATFIQDEINYDYNNYTGNTIKISKIASNQNVFETFMDYPYSDSGDVILDGLAQKNIISSPYFIDKKVNGQSIENSEVKYLISNGMILPKSIYKTKLPTNNNFEDEIFKFISYNENGQLREFSKSDGVVTVLIYGYYNSKLIAKIENANYADVQSYESNLQNISNTGTETNLINALNSLRTALPNALITTYTHKSLIGISTVTDPKGDKQTYHYDGFNRLQFVKDAQGNILSENEYHYKN